MELISIYQEQDERITLQTSYKCDYTNYSNYPQYDDGSYKDDYSD